MAETATRTTRTRKPTGTTTARKTTPAKTADTPAETTTPVEAQRIPVELEHVATTKSYEKFGVPADVQKEHGVVGNLYAPLGTTAVKVLVLAGPAE